jgi:hypothetical protein
MESKIKKANIRINKIIKKHSFEYLLSICSTKYLIMGPYTQVELLKAQTDIINQIRKRLFIIYNIFGKELLSIWNLPILTNNEFENMEFINKINLMMYYGNTLTNTLNHISNQISNNQ